MTSPTAAGPRDARFPISRRQGRRVRSKVTAMIDGANKSQRMMGDQLRGMCKSVVGAGVSVMK